MTDPLLRTLSPVHFADLPQAADVNRALIEAFERTSAALDVRRTHKFAGRYENTYIPAERLPELTPVRDFAVHRAATVLGIDAPHHGFWFNEMRSGQRTTLHDHAEADELLSGVYYLSCAPGSGRLVLHDDDAQILITPRPGLLVLFPPDLPHEVEQNSSTETRLSIAFNFGPPRAAS
ncbi:MAG: 2OG-Fe(II) oxygenase family protein [Chromatiaceae bacterium]|jgi:hypothetical protein|nr:2OG-Fe(II) oxygenase family protein [Chromatiaceae bacterium]